MTFEIPNGYIRSFFKGCLIGLGLLVGCSTALGVSSFTSGQPLTSVALNAIVGLVNSALQSGNNLSDVTSRTGALNNLLPSQVTNSGLVLMSNGTNSSWGSVLPSQATNTGKVLSTTGTGLTWITSGGGIVSKLDYSINAYASTSSTVNQTISTSPTTYKFCSLSYHSQDDTGNYYRSVSACDVSGTIGGVWTVTSSISWGSLTCRMTCYN